VPVTLKVIVSGGGGVPVPGVVQPVPVVGLPLAAFMASRRLQFASALYR
jgi:hypothetical protein